MQPKAGHEMLRNYFLQLFRMYLVILFIHTGTAHEESYDSSLWRGWVSVNKKCSVMMEDQSDIITSTFKFLENVLIPAI